MAISYLNVENGAPVETRTVAELRQMNGELIAGMEQRNQQIEEQRQRIVALEQQLQSVTRSFHQLQDQWQNTWDRLGTEANNRGWCDEYDEICAELGGIPRKTEREVRVKVKVHSTLSQREVLQMLHTGYLNGAELDEEVEVDWGFEYFLNVMASADECACENIDDDLSDVIGNHLRNSGVSYESIESYETSCGYCN